MNPEPADGQLDSSNRAAEIPPPWQGGFRSTIPVITSAKALDTLLTNRVRIDEPAQLLLAARRPSAALACNSTLQRCQVTFQNVTWILTDPVITPDQIEELGRLACQTAVHVTVDHFQHVEWIRTAAAAANATVGVIIQIDPGNSPGGLRPGHDTGDLARATELLTGVRVSGLAIQHPGADCLDDPKSFRDRTSAVISSCRLMVQQITQRAPAIVLIDFPTDFRSFADTAHILQDSSSATVESREETASLLQLRVRSRPSLGVCILDAGRRTPGVPALPEIAIPAGATVRHVFDHHIEVTLEETALNLRIGDTVMLQTKPPDRSHVDAAESSTQSGPESATLPAASAIQAHVARESSQSPLQRPPG